MTGHGEGQCQQEGTVVGVEVRTVNNRFLKVSTRVSEGFNALEPQIEAVVRQQLRRGSVQVNVRIEREVSPDDFRLNEVVLAAYRRQLESLNQQAGVSQPVGFESLLTLPGVVDDVRVRCPETEKIWPLVEQTLIAALESLSRMRAGEGAAMAADLQRNARTIAGTLQEIERRAPVVVEAYRRRLLERLNTLLADYATSVEPADVVREVGVFADRSDISEEVVRLRSHLEQFESIAGGEESNGRKLEFVIQEMLRETNTIGSKANDAEIAHHVVEIKTALERIREMIQNVE
jgi:uncharacterized protein (TIGR00255 family)